MKRFVTYITLVLFVPGLFLECLESHRPVCNLFIYMFIMTIILKII